MSRMSGQVLLVGSIPGDTAEEVLRACGRGVGECVTSLPDGETGYRRMWIHFLAVKTYHGHPVLETIQQPRQVEGEESWFSRDYDEEGWLFKVKDGIDAIRFDHLGYAAEAKKSYQDFCTLRDKGAIPSGVKFQVSLPLTESGIRSFLTSTRDFDLMWIAYEEAMARELAALVDAIPADDLVIQWDICVEVFAIALQDQMGPWQPAGDPFERYLTALTTLATHVPAQVPMGCHLCYGDLGHKHLVEPADLSLVVRMANAAHSAVARPVDFYHMPVPRNRDDAAYFAPLTALAIGDAKLFLGLIHHTDGVAGAQRRVQTAHQYRSDFGIATECGFGRRPAETIPELLRIHREVASGLSGAA